MAGGAHLHGAAALPDCGARSPAGTGSRCSQTPLGLPSEGCFPAFTEGQGPYQA